ncbi:MAG: hypothetical protein NZM31_07715 [Gemmatales bacterium]|nr:hypothetical protein [Gemmatales bacterium]MDW8386882.1 hypothetical protein [Gemmatales bacterium]
MSSSDLSPRIRRDHDKALEQLVERLEQRLGQIEADLELACANRPEMRSVFQETWKPRFEAAKKRVDKLRRMLGVRQSLFVMGKRGQGKTTLLRAWIGSGIRAQPGHEALPLPTGVEETTCCLVRLTESNNPADPMQVDLLPAEVLSGVEPRPARPLLDRILLSRAAADGAPDDSPFFVLRYPVKNKDHGLRLHAEGSFYYVGKSGELALTSVQYHTREVTVPLFRGDLQGHARQLLEVLDIVDAPGADPAAKGEYAEWVRHKNREVIRQGMDRLDLLLLVCSAQTAAINLSAQVQEDVLKPWVERCKYNPHGRLLLTVTHAAELLDEAKQVLKNGYSGGGVTNSVARKLVGNILEPLAAIRVGDVGLFEIEGEVRNWPPLFFLEHDTDRLKEYREAVTKGRDAPLRDKLTALLGKPPRQRIDGLPLGEACVMQLVNDWGEQFSHWPAEKLRRIQSWLIRSLCSLLDPEDCGLKLLTDFVRNWAESGPIAENHAQERHDATLAIREEYDRLLDDLNQPDYKTTLEELHKVRSFLEEWWRECPVGLTFELGDACRARLVQAEKNRGPKLDERREFTFADVVEDLVQDFFRQVISERSGKRLSSPPRSVQSARPGSEHPLLRALRQCLLNDHPMQELDAKYRGRLSNDPENVARLQAVGFERLVRILHFLGTADDEDLRAVARYCYGQHIEQSELLRPLYHKVIEPGRKIDGDLFDQAIAKGELLLSAIRKRGYLQAYE